MFLACAVWYVLSIIKTRKWKKASGEVVQCWTTGTECIVEGKEIVF